MRVFHIHEMKVEKKTFPIKKKHMKNNQEMLGKCQHAHEHPCLARSQVI